MSDINATEAAVELAKAEGVDLSAVVGTGAEGRILKSDVELAIAATSEQPKEPVTGGDFTNAGGASADLVADLSEPETRAALVAGVNAHLVDAGGEMDETAQAIAQLSSLGAVVNWAGDRETYAVQLRSRAKELLEKA